MEFWSPYSKLSASGLGFSLRGLGNNRDCGIRSLCGIFYLIPLWNSILLEVNKLLQDLDFLCAVWETLVLVVLGSLLCTLIFVFLIANSVL